MTNFPKARYPALFLAIAFVIIAAGNGGDFAATISSLGTQAAAVSAAIMAIVKIVGELMATFDANDPMTEFKPQDLPDFWRRVL